MMLCFAAVGRGFADTVHKKVEQDESVDWSPKPMWIAGGYVENRTIPGIYTHKI